MSFNTQNTQSFIHKEQYGKKVKKVKTTAAKKLSTGKASKINTFTSLNLKSQVTKFKPTKISKLTTKRRKRRG